MVLYFVSVDGLKISVGENAVENDQLVCSSAKDDLWFHLDDGPSCHVILHSHNLIQAKQPVPKKSVKQCFQLCKHFSKRRKKVSVPAIYCKVRHLRTTEKMGAVQVLKRSKPVSVKTNKETVKQLLEQQYSDSERKRRQIAREKSIKHKQKKTNAKMTQLVGNSTLEEQELIFIPAAGNRRIDTTNNSTKQDPESLEGGSDLTQQNLKKKHSIEDEYTLDNFTSEYGSSSSDDDSGRYKSAFSSSDDDDVQDLAQTNLGSSSSSDDEYSGPLLTTNFDDIM